MAQKRSKNVRAFLDLVKIILKKVPPSENCFSIIGPNTVEGSRSFNIECDTTDETTKWVEYLEIVINYFRKNQKIKSNIVKK